MNTYAVSWNLGNWTLFFTSNVKSLAAPRSGIFLLNEETEHFSVKLPVRPNKIIAVWMNNHFSFYWSDSKFFCIYPDLMCHANVVSLTLVISFIWQRKLKIRKDWKQIWSSSWSWFSIKRCLSISWHLGIFCIIGYLVIIS